MTALLARTRRMDADVDLLHFDALDWRTTVHVNGQRMGEPTGGYDAI